MTLGHRFRHHCGPSRWLKPLAAFICALSLQALASDAWADRALLLSSGHEIARATLDMIASAESEVVSVEFLMRDDDFGRMKMALLWQKAREGKRVVMQVDALHFIVDPAYKKALMDAGVELRVFNKFELSKIHKVSMRDHTKLLVTDNRYLRTGDSNTGDEYVEWGDGHHMKSRDVFLEGEAAKGARHYAFQLYQSNEVSIPEVRLASEPEVAKQRAKVAASIRRNAAILKTLGIGLDAPDLLSAPKVELITETEAENAVAKLQEALNEYQEIRARLNWGEPMKWAEAAIKVDRATFLHDPVGRKGQSPGLDRGVNLFIEKAQRNLTVLSPYLVLTTDNEVALKKALANGAKVEIGTNSLESSDNITVQSAYEYRAPEYAALGNVQLWEHNGPETWHAKMMTRDNQHVMVMSYNVDWRSMTTNMETAVYIKGKEFARRVQAQLDADRSEFTQVSEGGKLLPAKFASIRVCRDVFSPAPRGSKKKTSRMVIRLIEKGL